MRLGAEEVVCEGDPAKLGYLTVWAADYLAGGHTFAPGSYNIGGPVGSARYYSRHQELRLDQLITATQANLRPVRRAALSAWNYIPVLVSSSQSIAQGGTHHGSAP